MMHFFFSDRGWLLKAAAALGLLGLLFGSTHRDISVRYPPLERVALSHESLRNHVFHLTGRRVQAADADGFQIGTDVGPMHFRTSTPPAAGSYVSVNARPIGPRTLEVLDLAVLPGYGWKRPFIYAISILTVIGYLWLVRRRFRWQPERGLFRSRY
jgi:hypothetical protein